MGLNLLHIAFQHVYRRLHQTKPLHGSLLTIEQETDEHAKLVVSNPLSGGLQYIVGLLKADGFTSTSDLTLDDGSYNGGHLIFGTYHFWRDANGRFRFKSSSPGSSTDGHLIESGSARTVTTTPVTGAATDSTVFTNMGSTTAVSMTLPASPVAGQRHTVCDIKGDADIYNITVSPAAGTINGESSFKIRRPYGSVTFVYTGSAWAVAASYLPELASNQAPMEGDWVMGDRVWNSELVPGAPAGWICIEAGSPGTWRELAPVSL